MKEIKRMTVILRELPNINIYSYRKEIKDLQKRKLEKFEKLKHEGPEYIREVNMRDYERDQKNRAKSLREFEEAERSLNKLNSNMVNVSNRLQENFKRRIESVNIQNTRTSEITLKWQRFEDEQKEKTYSEYVQRQTEYMKQAKKNKK
jgi:hypothetical protein